MTPSTIELEWRVYKDPQQRVDRQFLDFVVDGTSLFDLLKVGGRIGCLGWLPAKSTRRFARELLKKEPPELWSGRCALYICSDCGDLGCGAVTVLVEKTEQGFKWSGFALESTMQALESDTDRYAGIGPFYFERAGYITAFGSF